MRIVTGTMDCFIGMRMWWLAISVRSSAEMLLEQRMLGYNATSKPLHIFCSYFAHYNEGAHAERGYCGCFSTCAWPSSEGCYSTCSTHQTHEIEDLWSEPEPELDSSESFGVELEVELSLAGQPRPGPRYCHCMRGPLYPDIDACGIWPDVF